jgi:hypothetical protein
MGFCFGVGRTRLSPGWGSSALGRLSSQRVERTAGEEFPEITASARNGSFCHLVMLRGHRGAIHVGAADAPDFNPPLS